MAKSKYSGSDRVYGSQKMSKESSIRRGSEDAHSPEDWLHNSINSASGKAFLVTTSPFNNFRPYVGYVGKAVESHDGAPI
jgi:hypothetical protein